MISKNIIRQMTEADLKQVMIVENLCHRTPWTEALFHNELANPLSCIDLLWRGSQLAGFICSWRVGQELNILNVATAPDMRRSGVARALLEHVLYINMRTGLERVLLEVRPSNFAAISLYQSFGFCEIDRRLRYYKNGEDALVMQLIPTSTGPSDMSAQIH